MKRKNKFIFLGVIVAICAISGIIYGLFVFADIKRTEKRSTYLLLSFIPVDFTIDITSNTSWTVSYQVDSIDQDVTSSGNWSVQHKGTFANVRVTLTGVGNLTLLVLMDGKKVCSKFLSGLLDNNYCLVFSPWKYFMLLAFLI